MTTKHNKMITVSTLCFFELYLSTKFKFVTAWIPIEGLQTFRSLFCLREIAGTSLVTCHVIYNIYYPDSYTAFYRDYNALINCIPPPPPAGKWWEFDQGGVKCILNSHPGTDEVVKQPHPVHAEITVQPGVGQCAPPP